MTGKTYNSKLLDAIYTSMRPPESFLLMPQETQRTSMIYAGLSAWLQAIAMDKAAITNTEQNGVPPDYLITRGTGILLELWHGIMPMSMPVPNRMTLEAITDWIMCAMLRIQELNKLENNRISVPPLVTADKSIDGRNRIGCNLITCIPGSRQIGLARYEGKPPESAEPHKTKLTAISQTLTKLGYPFSDHAENVLRTELPFDDVPEPIQNFLLMNAWPSDLTALPEPRSTQVWFVTLFN